jgi:hypothetical protein
VAGSIRRAAALLTLCAWTASLVLPLTGAHATVLDDVACTMTVLASAHPQEQFEPIHPPVDDGHCAVCHLQRAIHGAFVPSLDAHHVIDVATTAAILARWGIRGEPRLNVPTRAPPSA